MKQKVTIACKGSEMVRLEDLVIIQKDLKELSKENYEKLKRSILELGFSAPFFVWKHKGKLKVLDGTQRKLTLEQMKLEGHELPSKVPAVSVEAKNEKEAKQKLLSFVSQYGHVTEEGLYEFSVDAGFDAEFLTDHFDLPNIDVEHFVDGYMRSSPERDETEDEVPEPPKETAIKRGDIFVLGKHRLMCGDSTSVEDLDVLTQGDQGDLLLTDPPYGVSYVEKNAAVHGGIVKNAVGKKIENDSLDTDGMFKLWSEIFGMARYFKDDASYYVFSPQGGELMMMMQAIHQSGWQLKHTLIWVKQNFVFGRADYHYRHEPILYGWKKKGTHNWYADRKQDSVLQFDKAQRNDLHPTSKPVELCEYLIRNSSQAGDLVIDLFGGSGSTLIAAEKLHRKAYLMELDPSYVAVIVSRWEKYTGQKAELICSGKTKAVKSPRMRNKASKAKPDASLSL